MAKSGRNSNRRNHGHNNDVMFTGVVDLDNQRGEGQGIVAGAWTMANTARKRGNQSMEEEMQEEGSGLPLLTEPCIQDASNQLVTVKQIKPVKARVNLTKDSKRIIQPPNDQVFGLESLNRNAPSLKSFAYAGKEVHSNFKV